jgi:threonine dehydratase
VAERSLIGEGREALLSVVCPERPGAFKQLYSVIYPRAVTEFSYHLRNISMATEIILDWLRITYVFESWYP